MCLLYLPQLISITQHVSHTFLKQYYCFFSFTQWLIIQFTDYLYIDWLASLISAFLPVRDSLAPFTKRLEKEITSKPWIRKLFRLFHWEFKLLGQHIGIKGKNEILKQLFIIMLPSETTHNWRRS